MRHVLAALSVLATIAPAVSQRYHTEMVMKSFCPYGVAHLNDYGDFAVGMYGPTGLGIYVDGVNITPQWTLYQPTVTGISESGDVAWTDYIDAPNGLAVACKNTTILFQSVGIPYHYSETIDINSRGQLAWFGELPFYDGYVDQMKFGDYIGMPGVVGGPIRINDNGQLLWHYGQYGDLWVDTTNLTQGMLGYGQNFYRGRALNIHCDVLWDGSVSTWGNRHVYLNRADLTALYAPYSDANALGIALNSQGHVLWSYERMSMDDKGVLMLDGTDISTPVLGRRSYVGGVGLNDSGEVLWGADDGAGKYAQSLYVNDYDLSEEALPGRPFRSVSGDAINDRGQVLWSAQFGDNDYRFYLSTPVPEPSLLLLGLPFIAALARRRKSAG